MANVTLKRWDGSAWVEILTTPAPHTHTLANIPEITATAAELNVLDGITATTAELNYTDGVTSNIQTQLNGTVKTTGDQTIAGTKTFSSIIVGAVNGNAQYLANNSGSPVDANTIWRAGVYTWYNGTNVPAGDFGLISIPTWGSTSSTHRYNLQIGANIGGSLRYRTTDINGAGTFRTVWDNNNDGAGSGLDADLLDGQQGSYYAPLASPALTGTPTAPTAAAGTNTTQIATTAFVSTAVANVINAAPGALDTLDELAAALGDDANFASTVTNSLALKAPLASPALTGTPTAPTAAGGTNTTQIATTAFVTSAVSTKQDSATALTTSTSFGGDVSGTYNAIVVADDSHNHIISNVDGLQTALDGKAATSHTHAISDVTNLQTTLDGKASTSHNHTLDSLSNVTITSNSSGEILKWNGTAWVNNTLAEAGIQPSGSYLTGNQTITLSGDATGSGTTSIVVTVVDDSHNHIISNVDGLQTALDGKASTTHTHAISDVTNLQTSLDAKAALAGATFTGDVFAPRFIANPSSGGNDTSGAWGIADYDDKLSAVRDYITDTYYPIYHTGNKPGVADIDATGTPSSTTYLRGDGTWATVSGGSGLTNTGTGSQSTGVGDTSTATATNSSAFGYSADATSTGSTAIGAFAQAYTGTYVTVVGMNANATGTESVAIGGASSASVAAQATASRAIAIGYGTDATGASSIAIGDSADATALDAIQLGTGTNSTADTLQVFNYQLLDSNGRIPIARQALTDYTTAFVNTNTDATWSDTGLQLTLEANSYYYIQMTGAYTKSNNTSGLSSRWQVCLVIDDATTGTPFVNGTIFGVTVNHNTDGANLVPNPNTAEFNTVERVMTLYTTDAGTDATWASDNTNTGRVNYPVHFQGMLYTGTSAKTIKFRHRRTSTSYGATTVGMEPSSLIAWKMN